VLLLIQFAALILSTTIVFVDVGEQAVLEHFGKPVATLNPGAHFKLPWPADKIYRFAPSKSSHSPSATRRTRRARRRTRFSGRSVTIKEQNFLVANRAAVATSATTSSDTNDAAKAQPVGLITVSIPVQFQITNVTDWAYKNNAIRMPA
jgi:regulator of protease activity HflC (stomatin/prohibitin superfamily)